MLVENKLESIIEKKALLDQEMIGVLLGIISDHFKKHNDALNGITFTKTTPDQRKKMEKDVTNKGSDILERAIGRKEAAKEIQDRCLNALSGYLDLQLKAVDDIISEDN